ncbi:MAG: NosD domain-containing protein [Promethearchaeia archaeon]
MESIPTKRIIIFIVLGIVYALSPIINDNFNFNDINNEGISGIRDKINSDNENMKLSAVSGKIYIINNSGWVAFRNADNCTGQGTSSDPYIIKDLEINGGDSGTCIFIQNTDVYFKIENCTVYNSGEYPNAGIKLTDVENSQIIDNNCSSTYYGIYFWRSNYNNVSGNTVNDNNGGIRLTYSNDNDILGNTANNNEYGMYLSYSNINNLIGNTVNNNSYGIYLKSSYENDLLGTTANNNSYGIYLWRSAYTTVSGNTANNNIYGIYLWGSNDNTVTGNTLLGNDECIFEYNCRGNEFSDNGACTYGQDGEGLPFGLIISILSISGGAVILVATLLLNRRKKKRMQ